jgi:molybdopterin-binding protein
MNRVKATISGLETSGSITLVTLDASADITLQLLLIDTPETVSYLKIANTVTAFFKETEVILATTPINGISIPNQIPAIISHFENDQFLTRVHLNTALGKLSALVHDKSLKAMLLNPGDIIVALIKMNEIMLAHD